MYFPKSQITTDLYTNGGEFIYKNNGNNYVGYYWRTQSGKYYTGKTPQDTPIQELAPASRVIEGASENSANNPVLLSPYEVNISSPFIEVNYGTLGYPNYDYKPLRMPEYSAELPTEKDYQLGEFRRYFCRKSNEIIYLEISKDTFEKLAKRDSNYYWQLYIPFNIPWRLVGKEEEVYKINKNIVDLVTFKKRAYKFDVYLQKDYLKYYKEKP
jgi:hypothetical protein